MVALGGLHNVPGFAQQGLLNYICSCACPLGGCALFSKACPLELHFLLVLAYGAAYFYVSAVVDRELDIDLHSTRGATQLCMFLCFPTEGLCSISPYTCPQGLHFVPALALWGCVYLCVSVIALGGLHNVPVLHIRGCLIIYVPALARWGLCLIFQGLPGNFPLGCVPMCICGRPWGAP